MIASRRCVVLLLMVLAASRVARAQELDTCTSAIPANIQAGVLTQDILALLETSQTFRGQCERIAAAHAVHVELHVTQLLGAVRAETTIDRYTGGALRADVRIAFGHDYPELIAHELEHVIEQIDGVDLRGEMASGGAWLVDRDVFESRRACEAGVRVRRESALSDHPALTSSTRRMR